MKREKRRNKFKIILMSEKSFFFRIVVRKKFKKGEEVYERKEKLYNSRGKNILVLPDTFSSKNTKILFTVNLFILNIISI